MESVLLSSVTVFITIALLAMIHHILLGKPYLVVMVINVTGPSPGFVTVIFLYINIATNTLQ